MRFRLVGTAAFLLAVAPGVGFALGIGDIQLRSSLNAPLSADIELTATPEELASVRAQLASREAFTRYGLDYPAFLAGIQVRMERQPSGRAIIHLTSAAPMTEPFATLLVEVAWEGGRSLREYTVLFDPPTFAPMQAPAAAVAAPVAGGGDRSAAVVRQSTPTTGPAAAALPAAPATTTPTARSGEYTVRSGDSLSAIARSQFGTAGADQAMVAIYRGNQGAFEGNMNRLRAGAVLRVPDAAAVAAIDARSAATEIHQQASSWRASTSGESVGSAAGADPRLRLIPPAAPGAAGGSAGDSKALRDQVAALETERAELRRQLEIRNAEIARLAAAAPGAKHAPAPAPAPVPQEGKQAAAAEPAAPVAAEPAPAPTPAPPPARKKPAAAKAVKTGPTLLDRLKDFWFVPVGVLGLGLALVVVRAARRRSHSSADELAPFAVTPAAGRDTSSDTLPLRRPASDDDEPILVEESGTHERLNIATRGPHTVALDDAGTSMSVPMLDATAALQNGDPLADADFHMAYGLYDQAADLVKLAIQREPSRRDLKLKLLEVFFVWGNKDQFLQTARELSETRDAGAPGEWEKVLIMGKQLAPEDALFTQSYAGPASVDLNLEGGQNLIDFDLHGEPSATLATDDGVDFDLGATLQSVDTPTGTGLDFVLDNPARGVDLDRTATTREMVLPDLEGLEGTAERMAVDGPTVEQPTLGDAADTLAGKLDAHMGFQGGSDQTAELAIDDLGLDFGKFDSTGTGANLLDDSQLARALESADSPTLLAGMDETSRQLMTEALDSHQLTELLPLGEANQPTELLPLSQLAGGDGGATSMVAALDASMLDMDFDLDSNAATGKSPTLSDADMRLDLDVGAAEPLGDGEYQRTQLIEPADDATQQDLEPVTMSEVGTKLDLARAYMDMGDPDGARSILREVLQEGSAGQRQEAQRLIDSIPG